MSADLDEMMFSPEALLDGLRKSMGIEDSPEAEKLRTQMLQRRGQDEAMAKRIRKVFSSPDGALVLQWLIDLTIRRRELPPDLILSKTAEQMYAYGCFRAGENSVVDLILEAMAQASRKPRKKRDPL